MVPLRRKGASLTLANALLAATVLSVSAVAPPPAGAADCGATPYDCAVSHVGRGEFEVAIGLLQPLLAKAPRDLKALNLLGIALTSAGHAEAGSAQFRRALAIDPAFYAARKNLAINEFAQGRLEEARSHFEQVLKNAPGDEVTHVHLAEIHFQRKDLAAALAHYEKSGARVHQTPGSTLHYATALLERGQRAKAVAVLDRLPDADASSRFEGGVALGRAGAPAEAARFFGSAREGYKDPYAAVYNQTLMLIEAGQHADAIRIAEQAFAGGTRPAELYNLASRAYLGAGQVQQSYDALREATRLAPKAPENYLDLVTLAVEHQNLDLGMEIVDIGLRQLPDSWMLHVQRGVLLAMKSAMGEAEKEFETARRLAPDQAIPYAALAMAWMQSGQTEKAVEVLRAELGRRQDHVVPYIFAVALLRSGVDPISAAAAEGVEALRASIRANAGFAPARAELGRLLFKRGDADGAIEELEKAVALDPASGIALYNLAQAYRKKGDGPRAAEMATRVSRLNAQERGDDADGELRRALVRIVREGTAQRPKPAAEP